VKYTTRQGHLKVIMYNIYINNHSGAAAYVRLSSEKMQNSDSYVQKLKEAIVDTTEVKELAEEYATFLAIGGFCFILPEGTLPFPVENAATPLYIYVVCKEGLISFLFDPKMYGCISIKLSVCRIMGLKIVLLPYNPKAVWFPAKSGDELPTDLAVEAGVGRNDKERLYFGRSNMTSWTLGELGGIPCAVTTSSGKCRTWMVGEDSGYKNGDLLKNTGFELIRATHGDPVPPNAVMTGVTQANGSLFVGRVGGSIPCYITTENGKILYFVYGLEEKKFYVNNGEVMVLTR